MGRGKDLSIEEKSRIHALHDGGMSLRDIEAVIQNRSLGAIQQCVKKYVLGVETVRPGAKPCLSARECRAIIREVSNRTTSTKRVKAALNLQCSTRTISRVIKKSGIIVYKKKSRKPILSRQQRQRRVDWARAKLQWGARWKNIVFSDEKKFNLDGPDGNSYYYHDKRKPEKMHDKRHTGGGGVMVWGAIGWRGKSEIAFLEGNQDSEKYVNTLDEYLLPCGARIGGRNWIFMQDNAPIHSSRTTMAWLAHRNIRVLPWPARSPDLNPIENVWAMMSRMVYAGGKQYDSIPELKVAISAAWANLSGEYRQNLYNSMNNRVNEVVLQRGVIVNY